MPTRGRVVIGIGSALEPAPHPAEGRLGAWVAKPNPLPSLAPQRGTRRWQEWWGGLQVCTPAVRGTRPQSLGWEGSPSPHVYSCVNTPQNESRFQGPYRNVLGHSVPGTVSTAASVLLVELQGRNRL